MAIQQAVNQTLTGIAGLKTLAGTSYPQKKKEKEQKLEIMKNLGKNINTSIALFEKSEQLRNTDPELAYSLAQESARMESEFSDLALSSGQITPEGYTRSYLANKAYVKSLRDEITKRNEIEEEVRKQANMSAQDRKLLKLKQRAEVERYRTSIAKNKAERKALKESSEEITIGGQKITDPRIIEFIKRGGAR